MMKDTLAQVDWDYINYTLSEYEKGNIKYTALIKRKSRAKAKGDDMKVLAISLVQTLINHHKKRVENEL